MLQWIDWNPDPTAVTSDANMCADLGPYFTIDMAVGGCILAAWRWSNKVDCKRFAPIIASALIAGDGVW